MAISMDTAVCPALTGNGRGTEFLASGWKNILAQVQVRSCYGSRDTSENLGIVRSGPFSQILSHINRMRIYPDPLQVNILILIKSDQKEHPNVL